MTIEVKARARQTDPPSSWDAAEDVNVRKGWYHIIDVLLRYSKPHDYPMCLREIHSKLEDVFPYIDQITSRPCELVEQGYILELDPQPRATRSGRTRSQKVYVVAKKGIAYWKAFNSRQE
jgi:hypothetical protein